MAILEDVLDRILQHVLNGKLDVDDVFVIGQHQRLFQHLVLLAAAITYLYGTHPGQVNQFVRLHRVRQAPAQARLGGFLELAELQHQSALGSIDDVKAAGQPDDHQQGNEQANAATEKLGVELYRRSAAAIVAAVISTAALFAEHARQLAIEITPELLKIRRPLVRAFAATTVVVATIAPLGIIERHE